jgi:hypothetical protein
MKLPILIYKDGFFDNLKIEKERITISLLINKLPGYIVFLCLIT